MAHESSRAAPMPAPLPERSPDSSSEQVTVHGRRRLRSALRPALTRGQLLAAALCAVLGFALVAQVRQTQTSTVGALRQGELISLLQQVTEQSSRLDAQARELEGRLAELQSGTDRAAISEKVARDQLDIYGVLAGTRGAQGPGIELTIADPARTVSASMLLDVVQELRGAGAEAIQLGDRRIVVQTALRDGTDGVLVDQAPVSPPYRLLAIGDAATLHRALAIPGGILESLKSRDVTAQVAERAGITVSALHAVPAPQSARPAPQATP